MLLLLNFILPYKASLHHEWSNVNLAVAQSTYHDIHKETSVTIPLMHMQKKMSK